MDHQSEEIKFSPEVENKLNTEDMYMQLIGKNSMPDTPADLPDSIFLTPEMLGNFEEALLTATASGGSEQSGLIGWNEEKQQFTSSTIIEGNRNTEAFRSTVRRRFNAYFGSKKFIDYHTHPLFPVPSKHDIAAAKTTPRSAYIFLTGTESSVVALLQTKQSGKLPISEHLESTKTTRRLTDSDYNVYLGEDDYKSALARLSLLAEAEGFGFYHLNRPDRLKAGDFNNGLRLTKFNIEE